MHTPSATYWVATTTWKAQSAANWTPKNINKSMNRILLIAIRRRDFRQNFWVIKFSLLLEKKVEVVILGGSLLHPSRHHQSLPFARQIMGWCRWDRVPPGRGRFLLFLSPLISAYCPPKLTATRTHKMAPHKIYYSRSNATNSLFQKRYQIYTNTESKGTPHHIYILIYTWHDEADMHYFRYTSYMLFFL
jgi:hypothetical protein